MARASTAGRRSSAARSRANPRPEPPATEQDLALLLASNLSAVRALALYASSSAHSASGTVGSHAVLAGAQHASNWGQPGDARLVSSANGMRAPAQLANDSVQYERPWGAPQHLLLMVLPIQKTGSSSLALLLSTAVKRRGWAHGRAAHEMKPQTSAGVRLSIFGGGTWPVGWRRSADHADVAQRARSARLNIRRLHEPPLSGVVVLTLLRHPEQRLYSEYRHLKGSVSCHGSAWRHYQPASCNGTVLLPTQLWPNQSTPGLDEYKKHRLDALRRHSATPSFEAWLSVDANCAHNRMARQLAPLTCVASFRDSPAYPDRDAELASVAKTMLREHTVFGLFERYRDSIQLINDDLRHLFSGLAFDSLRLPPSKYSRSEYIISGRARALIRKRNAADLELYEYAQELFSQRLSRRRPAAVQARPAGTVSPM